MSVHALDLAIIVFYLLLMLYLGYKGWKLSRTSTDYSPGCRRMPRANGTATRIVPASGHHRL